MIDERYTKIGRKKGSSSRYLDVWMRKNGEDVPNSNIRANLYHGTSKDVIVNQTMIPLFREDEIQLMMSVEAAGEGKGVEEVIDEIESIVQSGTRVNINYYIDDILDEEVQEEIYEYFTDAETDDLTAAYEEFEGDYSEEELRLMRIKFMSEMAN